MLQRCEKPSICSQMSVLDNWNVIFSIGSKRQVKDRLSVTTPQGWILSRTHMTKNKNLSPRDGMSRDLCPRTLIYHCIIQRCSELVSYQTVQLGPTSVFTCQKHSLGSYLRNIDERSLWPCCHHSHNVIGWQKWILGRSSSVITSFIKHLIDIALKCLQHCHSWLCF